MDVTADHDAPVQLTPEEEQELLHAYEEIRRGEYVEAEDLLAELRQPYASRAPEL